MKIIKLSQVEDRESWLDARRGLITSTKARGLKPLSRGADRTPAGFWELLAEKLAIAKDGEKEADRGLRLQEDALNATAKKYKIKLDTDPGFWISDKDDQIAVSPDGSEPGDKPTYSAEAKCLDSKNHLRLIVNDLRARKLPDYNPFDSLKVDSRLDFQDQVLEHFIVNENQQRCYFTLYDDRMALDNLIHYVIVIEKEHLAHLLEPTLEQQKQTLEAVSKLIEELKNV